jgi:dimeric dUTPase (all-alpha-NTP-PPase superfamily)
MNISNLFKLQEEMENLIIQSSHISEDQIGSENVFNARFLAFYVKLSNLANITKVYKYVNKDEKISKDKLMLSFIDMLKAYLSIGNKYKFNIINDDLISNETNSNQIELFANAYTLIEKLKSELKNDDYINSLTTYIKLLNILFQIARNLELSFDELYEFYIKIR